MGKGGGGGKSTGKTLFSIAGLFVGAFNPELFGLGLAGTVNWAAGIYGASLLGNIWSATHNSSSNGSQGYSFDVLNNNPNADARIPIIYGKRRWSGYETWHSTSNDKKTLVKDVLLCEGEISSITNVKANNLYVEGSSAQVPDCSVERHYGAYNQTPPSNYTTTGGYKNCAWLRCNLKSSDKLAGGNPTITCDIEGRKVTDTRTSTYAYSENPATCTRDYLLSKVFGLGRWVDTSMIDEDSFRECADYCDEVIAYYVPNTLDSYEAVNNKIIALQTELAAHP
jgi:hypothetical protein